MACRIEIETPPEGGVTTESGAITCPANQACPIEVDDTHFDEVFIAEPASGWTFSHWKQRDLGWCGGLDTPCPFSTVSWAGSDPLLSLLADPDALLYLEPTFAVERSTDGIALAGEQNTTRVRHGTGLRFLP